MFSYAKREEYLSKNLNHTPYHGRRSNDISFTLTLQVTADAMLVLLRQ
jgi:hypothetical protein